jgi:hypothetical protein
VIDAQAGHLHERLEAYATLRRDEADRHCLGALVEAGEDEAVHHLVGRDELIADACFLEVSVHAVVRHARAHELYGSRHP